MHLPRLRKCLPSRLAGIHPSKALAILVTRLAASSANYDVLGRVYGEIDAGGLGVIHKYDGFSSIPLALEIAPGGNVGAGTVLWKAGTYDSKGRALTQTLAQGVTASATYFANTGLLDTLRASSPIGEELQNKSCAWASQGNLITRTDFKAARSESFPMMGLTVSPPPPPPPPPLLRFRVPQPLSHLLPVTAIILTVT